MNKAYAKNLNNINREYLISVLKNFKGPSIHAIDFDYEAETITIDYIDENHRFNTKVIMIKDEDYE